MKENKGTFNSMQLTIPDEARNLKCIIVKNWVDSLCMYLLAYVWQEGLELLFLFTENNKLEMSFSIYYN